MKHIWSMICEQAIVDSTKNTVSLVNVIENLNAEVPLNKIGEVEEKGINLSIDFAVVSLWMKDSGKKSEEAATFIEVYDPDDKKIHSFDKVIEITESYKKIRSITRVRGITIFKPGVHMFRIKIWGTKQGKKPQTVAEIPIEVSFNIPKMTGSES